MWLVSCGLFATEPPSRSPELTGTITAVMVGQRGFATSRPGTITVLVEEHPGVWNLSSLESAKVYFWVSPDNTTILVEQPDGGWRHGEIADLAVGQVVTGWYSDRDDVISLDSYPGKGTATDIAVHRD